MSELRHQLDAARREYAALRYPGDLAAAVLPPARSWRRLMWTGGGFAVGSLAAAATIVIGLARFAPADPASRPGTSVVMQVADRHLPGLTLPPIPELPKRLAQEVKSYEQYLPPTVRELFKPEPPHAEPEPQRPV